MSDRIFALALLAICALIVVQMWVLDVPFAYEPVGPKAFPITLALLMAGCCLALLASPDRNILWPEKKLLARGVALVTALIGYAMFFETLGFALATAIMVVAVSSVYGGRIIPGVLIGTSIGVFGYLFFDRLLQVSLPLGRIWGQ